MDNSFTFKDVKKSNYSAIYHLIYQRGKLSKQEIAHQLQLSLPTVTQNLIRLENEKLIEKNGQFQSSVGRRATAYAISPKARISIGVEILKKKVVILAVDLLGHPFQHTTLTIDYADESSYYKGVSEAVQSFISSLDINQAQVLGIGFAVQALTSTDGQKITYGKILNFTGLPINVFSQYLDYPCMFVHDAKGAATTELWVRDDIGDAVYLSIGTHLGGAIILNDHIYMGKEGHSGTVEHMTINHDGPPCYCGKKGCMETYSSLSALLEGDESLNFFFQQLRAEHPSYVKRWNTFLDNLAFSINNIHLVINREFILGGHISPYLEQKDLEILHEKVYEKTAFPSKEPFIHISRSPKNGVPIGAAIPFIQSFLNTI
ncbi:ROK family transcriptional regulator [Halobacillus karajensis]|uniref:N-acetylglucosamine repressor n=1 Tax=Halobacillus karajensis TaxID=195088 RepID=A0A024P0P8_9BACI|nr:ROK family transcriptional regulator [Halobacillus karajensis]CDQ19386.1 N-acetylglucosamine repressor [Halobacillus karajensis]CDQ21849.1 N-acetylglucosamine repressor [Halobacillus karajensis]CDQ27689.1 N-acetylglucosamine repressor [Halobacillus karajensis]